MTTDKQILKKLVHNMKQRGVEPLRPLIDAYLLERDEAEHRVREHQVDMRPRLRPGGRFSPSSICGCRRQAVFKFTGVAGRKRLDPDLELIFEDGIWRHHKWQAIFLDMEAVLGTDRFRVVSFEAPIEIPELYVAGNSDEVVRARGRKRVIDFKGANEFAFTYVATRDEPKEEHVRQIMSYLKGHKIPKGSLFYDNKNNQHTKIFDIDYDDAIWYEIQEWVEDCIGYINGEQLPPMHPDCQAGTYLWQKCPYARICYGTATDVKIRRHMYKDFPGVDEAWEEGRRAIQEDEA